MVYQYKNRNKAEGMQRDTFAQNRSMMTNFSARNISSITRNNNNYSRRVPMQNSSTSSRPLRSQASQFQIPARSSTLNNQCFDFGIRSRDLSDYPKTNSSSKYFHNRNYRPNILESARSAKYSTPVQNSDIELEYSSRVQQNARSTVIKDEPNEDFRKIWINDKQPGTSYEVTPVKSPTIISLEEISNFRSPSPWFPASKNLEPSYKKVQPGYQSTSRYDTFNNRNNEIDTNRGIVHKWGTSTNTTRNFDDKRDYLQDSNYKEPVKNEWVIPAGIKKSIEDGEFYAKVCEAVLEKVMQQLCPNSFKINKKSDIESFDSPVLPNGNLNTVKNAVNSFSNHPYIKSVTTTKNNNNGFKNEIPQLMDYRHRNTSYSSENRKSYAPKPLFNRSFRGRGAGRVTKRQIPTGRLSTLV